MRKAATEVLQKTDLLEDVENLLKLIIFSENQLDSIKKKMHAFLEPGSRVSLVQTGRETAILVQSETFLNRDTEINPTESCSLKFVVLKFVFLIY